MHEIESPEELHKSIFRFRQWLQAIVLLVLITYIFWFAIKLNRDLSIDVDAWGQFGDFVGGILNPLIAYAAFHWITKSVLIQGRELTETRLALREAAIAQTEQARLAKLSIRMNALRAVIDAVTSNIEFNRRELEFVAQQLPEPAVPAYSLGVTSVYTKPDIRTLDGLLLKRDELEAYQQKKISLLTDLGKARDSWLKEMRQLMNEHANSDA